MGALTEQQLRAAFLERAGAAPERYLVLDATTEMDDRTAQICERLEELLEEAG